MTFTPTTAYTDWFLTHFETLTTPAQVNAAFYTRAPALDTYTAFTEFLSFDFLDDLAEWVPLRNTMESSRNGVAEDLFVKAFVMGDWAALKITDTGSAPVYIEDGLGWTFLAQDPDVVVQEQVMAVVFYLVGTYGPVTDPIMFATTQGIGDRTVVHNRSIFGQTEDALGGSTGVSTGWLVAADTDTYTDFHIGSILLDPEEPEWESAHAQHMWLEPQRTNLIANPSFETWGT